MLLVKTTLGPSSIHGIGLFAAEFIPKGTPIWKYQDGFDFKIDKASVEKLSAESRSETLKYAYLSTLSNQYILCSDDARFFNHSDHPNCEEITYPTEPEGVDIAARDIQAGEELTCDYRDFDADFDYKMSLS